MTNRKLASRQAQQYHLIQNLRATFESYQRSYNQLRALANAYSSLKLFKINLEPLFLSYGLGTVLPDTHNRQTEEHLSHSKTDVNAAEQSTPHKRLIPAYGQLPAARLFNTRRNAKDHIAHSEASVIKEIRPHSPLEESVRLAEPPIPLLRVQRIKLHKEPDSKKFINIITDQNKQSTLAPKHISTLQTADLQLHQLSSQQRHQDLKIKAVKAVEGSLKIPLRQSDLTRAIRLRINSMKVLMDNRESTVTRIISRKELEIVVKNSQKKRKQIQLAKTPWVYSSEATSPGRFHSTKARFNKYDDMAAYAPFARSFATLMAYTHNEENIVRVSRGDPSSPLHRATSGSGINIMNTASHLNNGFPGNHGKAVIDHRAVRKESGSRHKGERIQNTYNTFNVSISADAFSSQELMRLDLKDELQRILTDEIRRMGIDV